MKARWLVTLCLVLEFSCWSLAFSQPAIIAQAEISYPLDFVKISGCEFYRNGKWHDSEQAQMHLRTKFDYLSSQNHIELREHTRSRAVLTPADATSSLPSDGCTLAMGIRLDISAGLYC